MCVCVCICYVYVYVYVSIMNQTCIGNAYYRLHKKQMEHIYKGLPHSIEHIMPCYEWCIDDKGMVVKSSAMKFIRYIYIYIYICVCVYVYVCVCVCICICRCICIC